MYEVSVLLLLFCSFIFYIHLKKIKRQRKLSTFEFGMLIMTQAAYLLWAGSTILMILDKS
ncbi:hypothetical protein LF817_00695 [Halobacillus sp. A1]|nr:hypothetical protein [Halobacillus sp. A1]MCP3029850.1 hypothetical protein [Halobacillus sp. A1]